jgi:predicted RNA-binding Zn ribbon-like protein
MTTDPANPAPGGLRLVQDFANTDDRYNGRDALSDPDRAAASLVEQHLLTPGQRITPAELATLHGLRDVLRALAATNGTGQTPDPDALAELNRISAAGPHVVEVDTDDDGRLRTALTPHRPGLAAVTARLTGAVHEAVLTGAWTRIKACANPSCAWLFYDTSRSRTGRWCSMRACGSIHKARTYRSRKRDHVPGSTPTEHDGPAP